MDAAQSNFRKLVLFLATALLLSALFRASAGSAQPLSASTTNITLGSASCNDFQTISLTSSGGASSPVTFTVAVNYQNGDTNGAWLYATTPDPNGATTSTPTTISGSTGTAGLKTVQIGLNRSLGSVTDTGYVVVTPTDPAGNAITITVNYTQNANCGNSGTIGNGFVTVTPSSLSLSAGVGGTTSQTVAIQNITSGAYVVNPSVQNPWLSVSTNPITLASNQTYNLTVNADASQTSGVGSYSGTLVLSPGSASGVQYAGTVIDIPVTLTVGSGNSGTTGTLTVNGASNTSIVFNYVAPNTIAGNCVNLVDTTSGVTGYSWNITTASGGPWLLGPNASTSGSTPQNLAPGAPGPPCINLTVNQSVVSNLAGGAYQGTVTVNDMQGSTATITANLYVAGPVSQGITVSPGAIYSFSNVAAGSTVQQQTTFTVSANSGYNLGLPSLSNSGGDFSISTPTQNSNSLNFTVTSNSNGMSTGLYAATITIPSNFEGGANSNTIITVVQPIGQSGSTVTGGTTTVAPTSLSFQQQSGSQFWIGQQEAQALTITGPQGTTWSASIIYSGGTPQWLSFDNSATSGTFGSGPVTLMVDLFNGVGSMAASSSLYQATVQITTQNAGQLAVPVTLLVTPSNVPVLLAEPASTTFSSNSGANPASKTVTIVGSDNPSSTTPGITAGTPTASWVTAVTNGNRLTLSANVSGLATGLYWATVPISAVAYSNSINYPVVLVVNGGGSSNTGPLTLSSTSLSYTNVTGAITQNLSVSASTATQFTLSSTETTCTSANWLQVVTGGYTASATATQIAVTVSPSGIANGTTCTGQLSLATGTGSNIVTQTVSVSMTVGTSSGSGNVTVSPSTLSPFQYTQGQSAPPAQTVSIVNAVTGTSPISFTVSTTETNGNSVNWLQTSATTGTTPYNNLSISVAPGSLPPNTYTGTVTIQPNGGTAVPISVTMTITGVATVTASPTTVSWSYIVGGNAPTAATIQVTAGGAAAAFTATAASTGGWLQVTPTSGTTPNTGTANLTVSTVASALAALLPQSAPYTGTVTVQGVTQGNTQATGTTIINVSLTVTAPLPVITGVTNAASGATGPIAQGEIISIYGNPANPIGPATSVQLNSTTCPSPCTQVPNTMGGVTVYFLPGNEVAPLLFVNQGQINAVVPYTVAGIANLSVEVKYLGQTSNAFPVSLATGAGTAPGLFTLPGSEQAAALQFDAQGNPQGYNASGTPAKAGWILELFLTGEGAVSPPITAGSVTPINGPYPQPLVKPNVLINNQPATVSFYGEAPGLVSGVLQLNVVVPPGAGTGPQLISISMGTSATQAGVTVYLQ